MYHFTKTFSALLTLGVMAGALPLTSRAADTVIDFTGLAGNAVPNGYLSNALNTPDIALAYRSYDPLSGNTVRTYISSWDVEYGDLIDVGLAASDGLGAEIAFTPTNGASVTLTSFELAGWPLTDYTADVIQVVDASNTVLWSAPSLTVAGAGPAHTGYSVNVTSSSPIYLRWGNNWNIGIDNVTFSQTSVAPEPGSLVLLALGAMAGFSVRRTRRPPTMMAR